MGKEDIMRYIGLVLIALGTMMADSDRLIVPAVITGIGALMLWRSTCTTR